MRARLGAAALLLLVSACGGTAPSGEPDISGSSAPAGWRWESYGGVRVSVPGHYGHDNGTQRLSQWCVGDDREPPPAVGRPGPSTLAGCPPGGASLANTGAVVAFEDTEEPDGITKTGDRITVRLAGVAVVVQTPADVREKIAATVSLDNDGVCPATHPVATDPAWRPTPPGDLATLRDVESLDTCRYRIARNGVEPLLKSSLRVTDSDALAGLAGAPDGGGPDEPGNCTPDYSYGEELLLVRATGAAGTAEIVIRYAGCDHNGVDDGRTVRRLTPAAGRLLSGPHQPYEFLEPVMEALGR